MISYLLCNSKDIAIAIIHFTNPVIKFPIHSLYIINQYFTFAGKEPVGNNHDNQNKTRLPVAEAT